METDPHTQTHTKQTHRQDHLQYTAPLSLAHSVITQRKKEPKLTAQQTHSKNLG